MSDVSGGLAGEVVQEFQKISGNRGNWETHWQEIAERIWTMHSASFYQNNLDRTKGETRTEFLLDSTATEALKKFGAILDSLLTPRNQTWHRLLASNADLNKDRDVKLWFEEVNRRLFTFRYAPKANFASQNQMIYKSLGAYGTGALFIDELQSEPGVRYKYVHLSEIYFRENHQGLIDTAYRRFSWTPKQIIDAWGETGMIPERVTSAMRTDPNKEFAVIHRVKPNPNPDPDRQDSGGMDFMSHYVIEEGRALVESGGFRHFPYAISRYEQAPNEVYGRSPAMDILPAIKTLNEEKKVLLKQGHRSVDPVLLAHDDGVLDSFSLKPGAINAGGVSKEGRMLIQPLPTGNHSIGKDLMDDERAIINESFLVTLFQILVDTPQMTATEVLERTKEKGILLAPTLGRLQSEYLGPLVEREIQVLLEQGQLPELPPALVEAQGEYRIEYDSPLSRTQRAEEGAGFSRMVDMSLQMVNATQDPRHLDHFNFDAAIPELAIMQGVPTKWLNDQNIITARREQRQQQAQEEQAVQAAPAAAALAKAQNQG